jgi:hypothetical protein
MAWCLGCLQADQRAILSELDWTEIFERCPHLAPPGYEEAVQAGQERSKERYERLGKKRAGTSSKSKTGRFPGLKHKSD